MNDDLIFMHCDHRPLCDGIVDKVFEGYSSIQFMAAGELFLSYGDRRYNLADAWVWAAWPGPHTIFRPAAGSRYWDHRYLAFRGDRVDVWKAEGLLPSSPVKVDLVSKLANDFDRLIGFARRGDARGRAIADRLVEALLLTLADGGYEAPRKSDFMQVVDDWLYENRFGHPDYDSLARIAKMSVGSLRRKYRQASGMALHTRFLNLKLEEARELLTTTDRPIKDIAAELGYSDVFFFHKQFRKRFGVPPGEHRHSVQV